ncbi:hypothetical protein GCM10023196_013500 [Actinoallomurus vinaceus]|uniref:Secreted protein n=1 Tax=Actinoallomurus vinaceus TaxID=1080074 RepID=A0ABP8U4L5_9ACTN
MIHKMVLCEALNSTAMWVWATFSPDTEAMTAISAIETAIKIVRSWRASGVPSPLACSAAPGAGWFVLIVSSQKGHAKSAPE